MTITLAELKKKIKELNDSVDGINDELIKAIEDYQTQYERELRKIEFDTENGTLKNTANNISKAQSIDMVKRLKFGDIVKKNASDYLTVAYLTKSFHKDLGIDISQFNYRDLRVLKVLRQEDGKAFLTEGMQLDNFVKKQLVNGIALGQSRNKMIDNLAKSLLGSTDKKDGRLARYSKTYINTAMQGLSRMIDKEIYDQLDIEDSYLYAGTVDKKIRSFCSVRVGKTFNKKEIEKFPVSNGSGLDPFFSPGGWNCRHRMIPKDLI